MALRVLLADNSETIKKVIQLSLQDFAAEVRSVNSGLDTLDVARNFQPDIIFADILLQKRNGYEVCADLKASPDLNVIPVVLMWSGFMDLDQNKAQQVRADGTLEKPFDSGDLRQLILQLVPKTKTQTLSQFMETPSFGKSDMPLDPPIDLAPPAVVPLANTPPPPLSPPLAVAAPAVMAPAANATITPNASANWGMDSFDDINEFKMTEPGPLPDLSSSHEGIEDFSQIPLNEVASSTGPSVTQSTASNNPFELDVPDEADFDGVTVNFVVPSEEITGTDFLLKPEQVEALKKEALKNATPAPAATPATPAPKRVEPPVAPAQSIPALSEDQIEQLLKNQSQEIIEKIVWRLIPDMAERIIRDEIKRLLDEPDMKA